MAPMVGWSSWLRIFLTRMIVFTLHDSLLRYYRDVQYATVGMTNLIWQSHKYGITIESRICKSRNWTFRMLFGTSVNPLWPLFSNLDSYHDFWRHSRIIACTMCTNMQFKRTLCIITLQKPPECICRCLFWSHSNQNQQY